ncbi:MAG: class D beta-lactamase [Verrucomicrobia bacterium]|nr:class D beta-lactamase [Verrucomicrobiota bacterium]
MKKICQLFFLFIAYTSLFSVEENFLLVDGLTNEIVLELGSRLDERVSPWSTFKVPLCLMGYDAGILENEQDPIWNFEEGYDDFIEAWKGPQTPQSWIRDSCIWYSKILSLKLGAETIQTYLDSMEYGNRDLSGGLAPPGSTRVAWIDSSLKISLREQIGFIQKLASEHLPVSERAIQMTKSLLFKEELSGGWKLYGRTGHGWFIGWIENGPRFFPFAYHIRGQEGINPEQRIQRVKQFIFGDYLGRFYLK